jgi:hypothetical protein
MANEGEFTMIEFLPEFLSGIPYIGLGLSFIFKEEIQAWWRGIRAKYVNNTYAGSMHWMKSHNFGQGEYVCVDHEKARGKGAGCHLTYINSGRKANLPWSIYAQYEFQDLTQTELDACKKAITFNRSAPFHKRISVESLIEVAS